MRTALPLAMLLSLSLVGCRSAVPVLGDADGDGFSTDVDCDDDDAGVNPDADEVCDGRDNDCDGEVDDGVTLTFFRDSDGD
ncbi:MAG: putative metal-binding motif-containing protein, partial [Deltaproteobacteria bacterium]|nr:putative metal-binding motif-containing protein [Deltaproteobacteria bacterium]